jgi:hypothetical protein
MGGGNIRFSALFIPGGGKDPPPAGGREDKPPQGSVQVLFRPFLVMPHRTPPGKCSFSPGFAKAPMIQKLVEQGKGVYHENRMDRKPGIHIGEIGIEFPRRRYYILSRHCKHE